MFFFFFTPEEQKKIDCSSLSEYIEKIDEITDSDVIPLFQLKEDRNLTQKDSKTNFDIYKDSIIENNYKVGHGSGCKKFFYRGHSSLKHVLLPSVFRPDAKYEEEYYYHSIKVECPEYFQNRSKIQQLLQMQHYGTPTRLLDITRNPLVALYFACINHQDEPGAIHIFTVENEEILNTESDKALMLASLAKFSDADKQLMYNEVYDKLKNKKIIKYALSNVMKRFEHEIRTENPSFTANIDPLDLLRCYFIQPEKINPRIVSQDGAFIITGLFGDQDELNKKLNSMVYKTIIITNKKKILKQLDKLGINEKTMFPEIDKISNYLKTQ